VRRRSAVTDQQVLTLAKEYRERLTKEGYEPHPIDFNRTTAGFPKSRQLEHVAWLCADIEQLMKAGDRERAMRHFGFAQGVLWVHGLYAVAELKEQNR
jgi:hypothetical protein